MKHEFSTRFEDITLVPLTKEDSEKYRRLRNTNEVRRFFEHKSIISAEQQMNWFEKYLTDQNDVMFSIYNDSVFIGCNSLYHIDSTDRKAEYGRIIIDKQFSGNGYGYKATMAALIVAKNQLNLSEIYLDVYSDNIAAIVSYKKAKFKAVSEKQDEYGRNMIRMRAVL